MQANLIDLFILALIALSGLAGLRTGFVKSFGSLFGTVTAFIIALLCSDDLALLLEEQFGARTAVADALMGHLPVATVPLPLSWMIEGELTVPTPAEALAGFILVLACFLLITFAGARILQVLFSLFNTLVSWGILGWVNSALGLVLVVAKNLLILTIILGVIQPAVTLAANLDYAAAQGLSNAMAGSYLVPKLLYIFMVIKSMLGIGSGV